MQSSPVTLCISITCEWRGPLSEAALMKGFVRSLTNALMLTRDGVIHAQHRAAH